MGKTANKQIICEVLMEAAKEDKDIVALCSDSRGSGSFTPFADTYPEQFVEPELQNRIWSVLQPDLQNVERNLMRFHRHASFLQEAMSSVKWMLHIPTRM